MPDIVRDIQPFLLVLLGWLMGLLSPAVHERIRRKYRRRDLMAAVVDELTGLQYIMALVAYSMRGRHLSVTDEFLDKVLPVIENYQGPERNEQLIEALRNSRKRPEAERAAAHEALRDLSRASIARQYVLPLFVSQISDLAICPIAFQRAVLSVRHHLDIYNQIVPLVNSLFDKTFLGLDDVTYRIVQANLEEGYKDLGKRAEIVFDTISRVKAEHVPIEPKRPGILRRVVRRVYEMLSLWDIALVRVILFFFSNRED